MYETVSQFSEILIFSQDIWENVHYVPEVNLNLNLWQKPFIFQSKQFKRNLRHYFVDETQLKIIMLK